MINAEILTKPFIMLYLNLDLQSLINDDLISEHNYNILSSIGDKIVEIMPSGKSQIYIKKNIIIQIVFGIVKVFYQTLLHIWIMILKVILHNSSEIFLRIYHWKKKSLYTLKSSNLLLINYIKII